MAYYPRTLRELIQSGLGVIGLSTLIGLLLWIGDPSEPLGATLAVSCWIGFWIHATVSALLFLFEPLLRHLDGSRLRLVLGPLFFVSGGLGFAIAALSLPLVTFGQVDLSLPGWGSVLLVAGGLGTVLGLAVYSYELLQKRLDDSLERLREQEWAQRDLETARAIQRRLLPPPMVEGNGFTVAAGNLPAHRVAGDFYDIFHRPDGSVLLVVADVSGKGLGASLVTASVKATLPFVAAEGSAGEVLGRLGRRLVSELGQREFVALVAVVYEPASGRFELANAGMPDPYLLDGADGPRALVAPTPRLPLGVRQDLDYGAIAGRLGDGERLLLYSDGLPEAPDESGEPLGYDRLEECLAAWARERPDAGRRSVEADRVRRGDDDPGELEHAAPPIRALFERFRALGAPVDPDASREREDDWTVLVLERRVSAASPGAQVPASSDPS